MEISQQLEASQGINIPWESISYMTPILQEL